MTVSLVSYRSIRRAWLASVASAGLLVPATMACNDDDDGDHETRDCDRARAAYVFPRRDDIELRNDLEAAGFEVQDLDLERSPWGLDGLMVIPPGVAGTDAYTEYMAKHADSLDEFVDEANVLLQLAQDPSSESALAFLPSTHFASRVNHEAAAIAITSPSNHLLHGMPRNGEHLEWSRLATRGGAFEAMGGFEVILASSNDPNKGLLLEGAYGQGRVILAQLDLTDDSSETAAIRSALLHNLESHTRAVCRRATGQIVVERSTNDVLDKRNGMTLAVLPDTQVYSLRYPGIFANQTAWLAQNAKRLQLRYVIHLGDIVNNNSHMEWSRARAAMAHLDGMVPYVLVPGNHDYGPSGDASTRNTLLQDYFAPGQYAEQPTFGGLYEEGRIDNSYHLFEAAERPWIIIALEWAPRAEVVEWANDIMDEHSDRTGILVTHAYLNHNGRRYDHLDEEHDQHFNPHDYATPGEIHDGEELWQALVRHHNFALVLNGHVLGDGTGYLVSETDTGRIVHQMLSNYQMRELGGQGYMRLLQFSKDASRVEVRSYSPLLDRFLTADDQQFEFDLDELDDCSETRVALDTTRNCSN